MVAVQHTATRGQMHNQFLIIILIISHTRLCVAPDVKFLLR